MAVLHKELEYKVEKLKNKKVGGHAAEIKSELPVGKSAEPPGISPHSAKFYRRDWLIQSIIYQ